MTTTSTTTDVFLARITPDLLQAARGLCADASENSEYVRGCAEVLIDATAGLTQDEHKDDLIAFLGAPFNRRGKTDEVLAKFTEALQPLIAFRDEYLDLQGFWHDQTDDPVLHEAAKALDNAFDDLDSVTNTLANPEDH